MNKLFLFALACIISGSISAQDSTRNVTPTTNKKDKKTAKRERINNMLRMEEEGELIFNKHGIFGIKLATDGYGISYERGKYKTNTRTLLYQFELNEKKNPKDHKVSGEGNNGYTFNTYVFGKLNNFYQFKAAVGEQFLIGGKGNKNGVAVTALYTGGLSLGILKPYFVDVRSTTSDEIFRSKYPTVVDSGYAVQGASGFFVGWGEAKFKPGINAKTGLRFDYGRFNESITAIEVGMTGEFYFSKIPMLYKVPEKQFFFNAYLTIMFGKRK